MAAAAVRSIIIRLMLHTTRIVLTAVLATLSLCAGARSLAAQDTTRVPRDTARMIDARRDSTSANSPPSATVRATAAKKPVPTRPPRPTPVWPVKGPDPLPGSILPDKRIVAFYGNPLSKRMGILGALPPDKMLAKLDTVVASWRGADTATPVQPALHLIAVVAQGSAGRDGKYRARMADTLIDRVLSWAGTRDALVFLDLQVGKSTLQDELPRLAKYLMMPNVHLAIDPEFSMKRGGRPGERMGTFDAADINYAASFLADLVTQHSLPPKVFVIHRFTRPMVTNSRKIALDPRVQIVMHMDGWGWPSLKKESYRRYIYQEPVQFTGFKLFYRNDTKHGHPLMTPAEVLMLQPKPLYIQYQ
jgi:hypothetical protein